MNDLNDLTEILDKNYQLIKEMAEEVAKLPSDETSWFYLLPNHRTDENKGQNSNKRKQEETNLVDVDLIEKEKNTATPPKLENKTITLNETASSQNEIEVDFFTSSQRNFSDLLKTDVNYVANLCKRMQIRNINDDELLELCSLFENNSDISVQTGSLVFKEALFYKIKNMESTTMSHSLRNCIEILAKKHPSCVLEGVLKPCFIEKLFDGFHADALSFILNVLPEKYLPPVLDFMALTNLVGDGAITFLEVIVKRGSNFEEENLNKIIHQMNFINNNNNRNIKFGKLFSSFLSVFHEQITKSQIDSLQKIANNHKSFMEKSIIGKLNNLSSLK